jgi:hypothetical protein
VISFFIQQHCIVAQNVYVTPSGKKYHQGNCRMVNNVSKVYSLNEAIAKGYAACSLCKPPVASQPVMTSNTARGSKPETVQCKGITKGGSRCRHMTSLANGYCYQHNPER